MPCWWITWFAADAWPMTSRVLGTLRLDTALVQADLPLAEIGLDARRAIGGVIGLAGPYDFLPLGSDKLKAIFGPPDQWAQTQPINFADGDAPPVPWRRRVGPGGRRAPGAAAPRGVRIRR